MKPAPVFASLVMGCVSVNAVEIEAHIYWRGERIKIPSGKLETTGGEKVVFTRVDFLLSQPELQVTGRKKITNKSLHYFLSGEHAKRINIHNIPDEKFDHITFHLGPSKEANHTNPAAYPSGHALNPLRNNLHWTPQGGYIFLAIEGRLADDNSGFAYHYGNDENRLKIPFSTAFKKSDQLAIQLHLDHVFTNNFSFAKNRSTHSRAGDPILGQLKKQLPKSFKLLPTKLKEDKQTQSAYKEKNFIGTPYPFTFPAHFPQPTLPEDYPLTKERVALGKRLFNDKDLSVNGLISCASCHQPASAFSDPRQFSTGHSGKKTPRHSMTMMNLAWKNTPFFWDGRAATLREQVLHPIVDEIEMGESMEQILVQLQKSRRYQSMFFNAYGKNVITEEHIAVALEQFILTLTSYNSKMDRAVQGKEELTEQEKRGFKLFMTENDPRLGLRGADCFHCHGGALFTNHRFHNNGLPITEDLGLGKITGKKEDLYKFSVPSLRNIAVTAPYMHDGRFDTLEEVIDFYSGAPHRSTTLDPNISKHGGKGLNLTEREKADLIAFLSSLTDKKLEKK